MENEDRAISGYGVFARKNLLLSGILKGISSNYDLVAVIYSSLVY
jgi:hypothetical protein